MSYFDEAINILKLRGYKITKPRKHVISALEEADTPLSPYEISDRIKSTGETGDVVGIYRSLEILEANHLVHKVISTGKYLKCKLKIEPDNKADLLCHHNLICKKCGLLEEVNCIGFALFERIVSSERSFKIEDHALEFYGLCSTCQI